MTIYYVDSAAGSNTAPYDTWGKAATTLATIAAIDVAGDTVYVASTHSESTASAVALSWAGTATAPTFVICADKTSGAPPATIATGAAVATTGASNLTAANAGSVYCYGINFTAGSSSNNASVRCNNGAGICIYENCQFIIGNTSSSSTITSGAPTTWIGCSVKFGAATQSISASTLFWNGGGVVAGGTTPTSLITGTPTILNMFGVDLSSFDAAVNLFAVAGGSAFGNIADCKLPGSWSGSINASTPGNGARFSLFNTDSGAVNYGFHALTLFGDVTANSSVYMSGGSSDGATPISHKFVTTAAAAIYPLGGLSDEPIVIWNNTTNASVTVTLEIVHDNATGLKNNEFWFTVGYLGSSSTPLATIASSGPANVLTTPGTLTSSSQTWNGTGGFSNANKQKATVTFTPQMKGYLVITPYLSKATYTMYLSLPTQASIS